MKLTDNELKEHCLQEAGIDLGRYSYNELNVIKDALRRYHNAKFKLLSIADVVGRSEQLVCECGDSNMTWYGNDDDKQWFCFSCKKQAN